MNYYHATKVSLVNGETVKSLYKNSVYEDASFEMDKNKPANVIGREYALYVADDPEFAVYYLLKEGVPLSEILLFEVIPNR